MPAVSPTIEARARKNLAVILRAMAHASQVKVAERMGLDQSSVSRMKNAGIKDAEVERIATFIAACGLKVVPEDEECYEAGYLESLRQLLAVELSRKVPTSGFGALGD